MIRRWIGASGALVVLSTVSTPGLAQTPAPVNVSVDATAPTTKLERIWAFHGYDEVNYATSAPGMALLDALGRIHVVPPHVRNHFLLNSGDGTASLKWGSTNVYTEDAAGNAVYDWTLTDGIMDAVTGAGAFPLVEIGFMPHDLSVHPDPYQNSGVYTTDGGCFYPPKDYGKWAALISAWAQHAATRYASVAEWQWELWNEPDLSYWHGTPQEYDQLFDYTEAALHDVLPAASLGGPAVATPAGPFLTQFLQHCATDANAVTGAPGTRLDMISFHAKGGVAVTGGHVEMNLGNQLKLHDEGFAAIASFPQFKQTPIVVSEADPDGCAACPSTQNAALAYRLSPAYGAYELAMMKHTLELEARRGVSVRGLVTWAFLFNDEPYFAGYRVLSTNGVDLPVLGAFRLLGGLRGDRIPATSSGALTVDAILAAGVRGQADVDALATFDGVRVQVLAWNYHDDLVTVPATPVRVGVRLPTSFGTRVLLSHLRVDESNGDAYTAWLAQGSPVAPNDAQLVALRQAMSPVALEPGQAIDVVGGIAEVDFDLPRFGASLITLAAAAPDAGRGSPDAGPGAPSPLGVAVRGGGCSCHVVATRAASQGPGPCATAMLALFLAFVRRRSRDRGE